MPNWSTNSLFWKNATPEQEEEINSLMTQKYEEGDGPLRRILPPPKGLSAEEEHRWRCQNWNTKWDIDTDDYNSWSCFLTAWSPPIPVVIELSKKYPNISFILKYELEGDAVLGQTVFKMVFLTIKHMI
ncbi:MAG: hypothetical protein HC875_37295 [Anaerolineales bacterium]|nr:hypothetical protein [Anaerolineales bacterium]